MARRTIATLTVTTFMDDDGDHVVRIHAHDPDGDIPSYYDLNAMISIAAATINDPEWAEQYGDDSA